MEHHRPGPLKQKNKPHKAAKKRVCRNSLNSNSSRINLNGKAANRKEFRRIVRKNQLQQIRKLKRDEILNTRRRIAVAPILISVIDFGNRVDRLWNLLQTFDPTATLKTSKHGNSIHVDVPKFRARYQLALLNPKDLYSSIDLARISDFLLVIHSTDVEAASAEESNESYVFDAIYHHCLPNNLHAFIGLDEIDAKHRNNVKRSVFDRINQKYPGIMDGMNSLKTLDTVDDLKQLLFICSTMDRRNKPNSYSSFRSQLLAEEFGFVPNPDDPSKGTLHVDGFIRHNPLDVNSLVYIPEFGEFQMDMIERLPNPYQNGRQQFEDYGFKIQADPTIRPSLVRENPVETILDQEFRCMEEDMHQSTNTKTVVEKKKVPKGTSDYQACWIVESDDDDDDQTEDPDDDPNEFVGGHDFQPKNDHDDDDDDDDDEGEAIDSEMDTAPESENEPNNDQTMMDYDQEINMEEEKQTLVKFKEQRMYEMFPDEIDTPMDRTARERFSKYRGLKSFRTSAWDKNENLPPDYSRIFQLANFDRTRRRLLKERSSSSSTRFMERQQSIPMEPGFYVRCHVIDVPRHLYDFYQNEQPEKPLILNELLPHEHRMSVMNIVLKKCTDYTVPIESKERLVFHVGYRRFESRPIFSAHTIGDKHKYEKYFRSPDSGGGGVCVATIYAPITYPPASVLVYKQCPNQQRPRLVATGTVKDCCPERLVIKRYVLSGHPFKINRKHAVIRYMFFNREDILWFRPVELRTKHGHHGHIVEPLGTHGHMKCRFDKQLSSQDTVLMYLYKRVFPKWFYEPIMAKMTKNENPDSVPPSAISFMDVES